MKDRTAHAARFSAMNFSPDREQRIENCRALYLKHKGQDHGLIEREMRALGYHDFHRRNLYRRFERGKCSAGWIERFGWERLVKIEAERAGAETQRRCDAGMAAAPAEGVVLSTAPDQCSVPASQRPALAASTSNSSLDFADFLEWLKRVSPGMQWEFRHQVYIYKHLKRVFDGELKRLMIFMPPRHGKSELVTKHFAAYWLKKNPSKNIIIGCYNQSLANKFSRGIRTITIQDAFLEAGGSLAAKDEASTDNADGSVNRQDNGTASNGSSHRLCESAINDPAARPFNALRPKNSAAEWETGMGGGVRAVGIGGGITGYGGDLVIIDDPVKSRAQANSANNREKVWDWFNDDIMTRLEPEGKIILIQTRWHEDDLAGRLLRQMKEENGEQWEVVNLPALAEHRNADAPVRNECRPGTNNHHQIPTIASPVEPAIADEDVRVPSDPLGRAHGEPLWPERFDIETLEKRRKQIGTYSFEALYQQRPVPAEGGLFKRHWFKTVPYLPPGLKKKRGWDLAVSKNAGADYTASAGVAYDREGDMYIYDVIRRRIEYPEQRKLILGRIISESDAEHAIELSANGTAVIQDLRRERSVRGHMLRGVKPKGDKTTRALSWMALAEEGRVFLVRGAWNQDFIDEACSFPLGTHDDQIDAVSLAVELHRHQSKKAYGF